MLQNAYLLAEIGADTAENEQHVAEILPKIGNYPTGRLTRLLRLETSDLQPRWAARAGGQGLLLEGAQAAAQTCSPAGQRNLHFRRARARVAARRCAGSRGVQQPRSLRRGCLRAFEQ